MTTHHREDYTFDYIEERKRNGEYIYFDMYFKAITEELRKEAADFQRVEDVFKEFHSKRRLYREGTQYYAKDIASYQRTINSIIRYAPTPAISKKYATLFFEEVFKPLRTSGTELTTLTNLVYVYGAEGSPESMEEGLDIIKLAMEIGVFNTDPELYRDTTGRKSNFKDPLEVFESVCKKVLRYHNLVFSADMSKLITLKK